MIAQRVGQRLEAIRFESFYIDGAVSEVYRAVFLRFDTWLRVTSGHGQTCIDRTEEPRLRSICPGGERLQYPINEILLEHAVGPVLGQEVLGASEIVLRLDPRQSYGFELEFESQKLRLLCIDGESLDLNAGRSQLGEDLTCRPLLRMIRGGVEDEVT